MTRVGLTGSSSCSLKLQAKRKYNPLGEGCPHLLGGPDADKGCLLAVKTEAPAGRSREAGEPAWGRPHSTQGQRSSLQT